MGHENMVRKKKMFNPDWAFQEFAKAQTSIVNLLRHMDNINGLVESERLSEHMALARQIRTFLNKSQLGYSERMIKIRKRSGLGG